MLIIVGAIAGVLVAFVWILVGLFRDARAERRQVDQSEARRRHPCMQ